ncbi:MAG: hypothetical protein IAE82_08025 [Opitutaceae bacterium]|nr:hypothetical protein [Opitutaceae bacterium]
MKAVARLIDLLEQYRPLFLARNRREKILLAAFIAVIVLIWAGSLPSRLGDRLREVRQMSEANARQELPLGQRDRIEADYQAALESLNPELFPPRPQVVAQLEVHASQAGLSPKTKIDPSTSSRSDRLTFHTVNVSFDRVPYTKIAEFQRAVAAALPSVNLKTIILTAPGRGPGAAEVNARLTYEAIEYTH